MEPIKFSSETHFNEYLTRPRKKEEILKWMIPTLGYLLTAQPEIVDAFVKKFLGSWDEWELKD